MKNENGNLYCDLCFEIIAGEPIKARLPMPGFEFEDCQGNTFDGLVCEDCANYIMDNGYNL